MHLALRLLSAAALLAGSVGPLTHAAVGTDEASTVQLEVPDRVSEGWEGPVVITGTNPQGQFLNLSITGPDGYESGGLREPGTTPFRTTVDPATFDRPGTYRLTVRLNDAVDTAVIYAEPRPRFVSAQINRRTLRTTGPARNNVTVSWRPNGRFPVEMFALNSSDRRVRTWADRVYEPFEKDRRAWSGRTDASRVVKPGQYRLRLVARAVDGRVATKTFPILVR